MVSITLRAALAACSVLLADTARAWNTEQPACPSPFTPFTYQGCYADPIQKGLIFRSVQPSDNMTVESCAAICKGNNFRYSGLEYYGICYCGNVLNTNTTDESQCNLPCRGDASEKCGGTNYLSVYRDPTFPDSIFSVGDYEDLGCYTDLVGGRRALGWLQDLSSEEMTPDLCLTACQNDGLPYAGLEYGGECWCGTLLVGGSVPAPIGDCSTPCNGDIKLLCGAGDRLHLYQAKGFKSSKPCGSETTVTTSATTSAAPTTTAKPETTKSDKPQTTKSDKPETTKSDKPQTTKSDKPETTKSDKPQTTKSDKPTESTFVTYTRTSAAPPVCTTVIPSPGWCCGNWCSRVLPDFDDHPGCKKARAFCHLQTTSCFKYAGWPAAWDCHKYKQWCAEIDRYCTSDCNPKNTKGTCSRDHCLGHHPPKGGPPPVTKTVPCATGTATPAPSSTATTPPPTVPSPENLCVQPADDEYDYGPGNPVGGIDLPFVACNNDRADHQAGKHFKCYTERHFDQCPSFERKDLFKACAVACIEQYDQCVDTYAKGRKEGSEKRALGDEEKRRGGRRDDDDDDERRGRHEHDNGRDDKDRDGKGPGKPDGGKPGDKPDKDGPGKGPGKPDGGKPDGDKPDKDDKDKGYEYRKKRCKFQYSDCLGENRRADPAKFCSKYGEQ